MVVCCCGILGGLMLQRVVPLLARAEQTAYERLTSELASALLLEAAERVVRGESETLRELDGSNPIELLLDPPGNYIGVPHGGALARLPRRVWYFDGNDGALVYRPGRGVKVTTPEGAASDLRLSVRFIYADRNANGRFDPSVDRFDGLRLEPHADYRWSRE